MEKRTPPEQAWYAGIQKLHAYALKHKEREEQECRWEQENVLKYEEWRRGAGKRAAETRRRNRERAGNDMKTHIIDAGYKALAVKLHPDKGGTDEAMTKLNEARHDLKRDAQ